MKIFNNPTLAYDGSKDKRTNLLIFVNSSLFSQAITELSNYTTYYVYVCQDPKLDQMRNKFAEFLAAKTEDAIRALKPDDPESLLTEKFCALVVTTSVSWTKPSRRTLAAPIQFHEKDELTSKTATAIMSSFTDDSPTRARKLFSTALSVS